MHRPPSAACLLRKHLLSSCCVRWRGRKERLRASATGRSGLSRFCCGCWVGTVARTPAGVDRGCAASRPAWGDEGEPGEGAAPHWAET